MENFSLRLPSIVFAVLVLMMIGESATAQQSRQTDEAGSYKLKPAPDLWFNSTDGIRAGLRLQGKQAATFNEGPHRLDFGLWLGTFIPKYPVSYYISYTEPIKAISGYNSEGNIRLRSSIRTGYHKHVLSFNKRWQPGFNEKNYRELSLNFRAEKRFDDEYILYPRIWQNDWLYIAGLNFQLNNDNPLGRYRLKTVTSVNLAGSQDSFVNTKFTAQQVTPLGNYFTLRTRFFAGLSSNNTAPEYQFSHSFKPYNEWDDLGTTRARGTIPAGWARQGIIQVAGGPNLRGYTNEDIEQLNDGQTPLYNSFAALNLQFQYPNPINRSLDRIPFAGLFDLRSYLFFDSGTSFGIADQEEGRLLSDAGLGFELNLNIPDYLGKSRGFAIRYEIPLWLSNPRGDDPELKYRSLIGIGAVISL